MSNKIKPIKPELRDLIEDFINFEEYQPIFKQFAAVVGYHGNDISRIRKLLFIPDENGDIGFSISGLDELLLEFQLIKELTSKPLYSQLLEEYPEAIQNIRLIAQKIYRQEDIEEKDLVLIFDVDAYAKRRKEINSEEADSSE